MEVQVADRAEVAGTRRTRDGYLVADVRIARAGNVQTYLGRELGMPDRATVRVYRDGHVKVLSTGGQPKLIFVLR